MQGAAGEALVRGFGVLFVMWNVPYAVAAWHPVRRRVSLGEAAVRFIWFDGAGLVLLLGAIWLARGRPMAALDR